MTLKLTVGGSVYTGFVSGAIERSFVDASPSFNLTYVDRWSPKSSPWAILPGDECALCWDDHLLIAGYVNIADWSVFNNQYTLTAAGRSLIQDLIDCAATHTTGQWRQKTMAYIAAELCEPFGISVQVAPADNEKFELFRLESGETGYSAIERMTKIKGYLITTSAEGEILIARADEPAAFGRRFSLDVTGAISRGLTASDQDRFSEYRITAQTVGSAQFNKAQVAKQKFRIEDAGIERYRPFVVVGNGPGHRRELEASARYERNVRAGRGLVVRYDFPGILDPQGLPWEPGAKIAITDPVLQLKREMILDRVTHAFAKDDLRTSLELVRPETYSVLDFVPRDRNARI